MKHSCYTTKMPMFFLVLVLGMALHGCQGEAPYGDPDYCYFQFSTEALLPQPGCEAGGALGYNLQFVDENNQAYDFPNMLAPDPNPRLIALPAGHTYRVFMTPNGQQQGACHSVEFMAYARHPLSQDACVGSRLRLSLSDGAGLRLRAAEQPLARFELPLDCNGCVPVVLPPPACQAVNDCEPQNNQQSGACSMPVPGAVQGSLNQQGDVDWFRFKLPLRHNCVDVTLTSPSGSSYLVELHKGSLLAGPNAGALTYCGSPDEIVGTLMVKVYAPNGGFDPDNCYWLQVTSYPDDL